jgi:hypothetical protein
MGVLNEIKSFFVSICNSHRFCPDDGSGFDCYVYRRWRVILGDVAVVVTVPFFAFPFFIVGGIVQAFTEGWPLFFFFWPMFFIGLIFVWLAASCSAKEVDEIRGIRSFGLELVRLPNETV